MNALVIVLSSQLLYYLLIAQTGIVGAFDSQLHDLFTLPVGGVAGALLAAFWRHGAIRQELYFLFGMQAFLSWFYPDYSLGMLLVLGFVIGYTTPLLLHLFGSQSRLQLASGLGIAYAVGTLLYTSPYAERDLTAVVLPLVSVSALRFARLPPLSSAKEGRFDWLGLGVMMMWIFADSALFETLSRSGDMDIWGDYTLLIVISHLLGIFLAYRYGGELVSQTWIVGGLFAASYLFYGLKEPIWLSVVYPVTISYYNVLLFQKLVGMKEVRNIALSMVGVGWIATSAAYAVALGGALWIAGATLGVFAMAFLWIKGRIGV